MRVGLESSFRQRLTRVTASDEFIPQVDGLRCLAILLVLGHHVFAAYLEQTHRLGTQQLPRDWSLIEPRSPLVDWALHLAFGVPLFFVISGFVLTIPFARALLNGLPRPSLKSYFFRRLIRLEPPYLLNLTLMFALLTISWNDPNPAGYFRIHTQIFAPHWLASAVYAHGTVFGTASWINGVAWTLEVEFQFYLLLPILVEVFRFRRWRRPLLTAAILLWGLLAQYGIAPAGSARLNLSLAPQLHFFLAGMLLADLYVARDEWWPRRRPGDLLALASAGLLIYVLHWMPELAWTEPLLAAGFCAGALQGQWAGRVFQWPLLTVAGGMSYTIYLYHFLIIRQILPFTVHWFPPDHALWWDAGVPYALMLPPVLAVSAVLFWCTERPFMVLSREVSRRFRASGTTP